MCHRTGELRRPCSNDASTRAAQRVLGASWCTFTPTTGVVSIARVVSTDRAQSQQSLPEKAAAGGPGNRVTTHPYSRGRPRHAGCLHRYNDGAHVGSGRDYSECEEL